MSQISIRRPHALSDADVRARVSRAATKLTERFGADCRWDGDVLSIEHSSVTGTVTLLPGEVLVAAKLGFPLAMFRARAETEIGQILDRELAA
jgi:putative polyhydroxyalkanoate system protein